MGIASLFLQAAVIAFGGSFLEKKYLPFSQLAFLADSSAVAGLSRGFGLYLAAMVCASFWVSVYGMSVGRARSKYMALAQKDGEKDAKLRYSLPNMYVEGTSPHARAFNCVQRSHQNIMETLPQFLLFSLASALSFPVTTAAACALWLKARMVWARGYAGSEGDPAKRYEHPFARHIWTTLIATFFMAIMSSANLMAEESFFW